MKIPWNPSTIKVEVMVHGFLWTLQKRQERELAMSYRLLRKRPAGEDFGNRPAGGVPAGALLQIAAPHFTSGAGEPDPKQRLLRTAL